jgi:hypothetical protein
MLPPDLLAIQLNPGGTILAVKLAMLEPPLCSVWLNYGGAVISMQFAVFICISDFLY